MSDQEPEDKGQQISVRVDAETVRRLTSLAPKLSTPYLTAKLADVVRAALTEGLPILEEKLSGEPASAPAAHPRGASAERRSTKGS